MRFFVFLFFFITSCKIIYAQPKILVPLTKFTTIDNRPIANIRSILKDKYGFAWIGTQDGLTRYDGTNAVSYNRNSNNPSLTILNNDVDALVCDPAGDFLWVLNSYGGISKIDLVTGKVIKKIKFVISGDSSLNFLLSGIEYYDGCLYIAAQEGYIFKINTLTDAFSFTKLSLNSSEKIQRICLLNNKFLLCLGSNKILLFDSSFNKALTQLDVPHLSTSFRFLVYAQLTNTEILLGTSEGVKSVKYNIANNALSAEPFGNSIYRSARVNSVLVMGDSVWVAYDNALIYYPKDDPVGYQYQASKGYEENKWLQDARFLYNIDKQIWIGGEYGIAVIKKENAFLPYFQDLNNSIKLDHCFKLSPQDDSVIYACTAAAFYKVNYNDLSMEKIGANGYYLNCFKGPQKEIFVSGFSGTFFKINNTLSPVSKKYPQLSALDKDVIVASETLKDSLFFFASLLGKGLYVFNKSSGQVIKINSASSPVKLKSDLIKKLFMDDKAVLWIIYDNFISLYNIEQNSIKHYSVLHPQSKEALNIIKDICKVKDDYYLAIYGVGVVQLGKDMQVKKIYGTAEGIKNVNLYKVFCVGDSLLIASGNEGLYTVNLNTQRIKSYFEDYGLHGNSFEELSGDVFKDKIFMGGMGGFTLILPGKIQSNIVKPLLYINKISIELPTARSDTSNLLISKIAIPSSALQTNIYFSAINYSNPGRTTFAYRIIEKAKDWININNQNFITLIGLSPGTYHLQVKAANEDGVWSEPKELLLEFLPKWYQTWWFKLLIALTIAGIVYALYRYRISQIKKQHEIRKNIATDLHDDLGSTLNSVKVFTNLAISGVNQNESLQQIKDNLNEATMGLRDMIWVLDDSLDTVEQFVTRLKQYALPVTHASNIETTITAASEINERQLTKDEKRNLFLVCKEVINNSIKYSEADKIDATILPEGKKIKIIITDNGKGFDMEKVKKGYGLKNMQYRAGQVKYKVILSSSLGNGTQVQILPV